MLLDLVEIPATTRGIYGPATTGGYGTLGSRQRWLEPGAARAFAALEAGTGGLVYSDCYRSASESLAAIVAKPGITQPPAYSAHNYGLAVDVAVDDTLALRKWTYPDLLHQMGLYGWYCHRRDERLGSESWHMNYLGLGTIAQQYLALAEGNAPGTWAAPVEAKIEALWGEDFRLDDFAVQRALTGLGLYHGAVDGIFGPLTLSGLHAFQRAWKLPEGFADTQTMRTMAFVTAQIVRHTTVGDAPMGTVDGDEVA